MCLELRHIAIRLRQSCSVFVSEKKKKKKEGHSTTVLSLLLAPYTSVRSKVKKKKTDPNRSWLISKWKYT